jgi:peptide/nickel transport system substrate-binding protein
VKFTLDFVVYDFASLASRQQNNREITMNKNKFRTLQELKYKSGQIDRRTFVRSLLATSIALPTALSIAGSVEAATPKRGGLLRVGMGHGSTTDTLDPSTSENGFTLSSNYAWSNHLTEVGPDGSLRPELAESYSSTDAKTWVFDLRQGVEFHNGKTMTSEDVIASLQYHMGDESKSAAKGLLTAVTSMKADGPNRVIIELASANADFPFIVSDYHLAIMPVVDGALSVNTGMGTGGYILEAFDPGVRAKFKQNPNYWKADAAHFDEVELISIIDVAARQNAMMNGDVDVIDRVDPKTVALLGRAPNLDILELTGTLHYTFPMRLDVAPFDNYDLRMALKYSLKRQELIDKILLGHGALGNDHPISTANRFHASGLEQREFDADKAAFHYKKSGHSGAIQLSSSDAAFAGAVDAAQLIAASAAEAGINIEVVREPKDGYWSNVWNKKGWSACYWGGRPTEDWMFSAAYTNDTEWNDTAWKGTESSAKFNDIVVAARAELDDNKRRDMYAECQRLINDDGGTICPMFANYIIAHSKKVAHGADVASNWDLDGCKIAERWWFA